MRDMLNGFKEFIMRGNVVDLAVAVVMGTAVTNLVTSFTNSFINPLLASIGGTNGIGFGFQIIDDNPKTFIDIGGFISAIINFLIIAAVLYFLIVMPINKVREKFARPQDDAPPPEDIALLRDIRDELRLRNERATGTSPNPDPRTGTDDVG